MKETGIGDFEETLLLLVGILKDHAYAFKIAEEFELQTKRSVSIGAVHSTLSRLGEKAFLTSKMGKATSERGGRRKRIYSITAEGQKVLETSREFKMSLWNQFPSFASEKLNFSFWQKAVKFHFSQIFISIYNLLIKIRLSYL